MFELTFTLHGFLFNITTTSELNARVLRAVTPRSRLWRLPKGGPARLVY